MLTAERLPIESTAPSRSQSQLLSRLVYLTDEWEVALSGRSLRRLRALVEEAEQELREQIVDSVGDFVSDAIVI